MQIRFQRRFRVMFSACFSLYILYVIFCFTFVPVLSLSLTSSLKFFDVSPLDEIIDTHIEVFFCINLCNVVYRITWFNRLMMFTFFS